MQPVISIHVMHINFTYLHVYVSTYFAWLRTYVAIISIVKFYACEHMCVCTDVHFASLLIYYHRDFLFYASSYYGTERYVRT